LKEFSKKSHSKNPVCKKNSNLEKSLKIRQPQPPENFWQNFSKNAKKFKNQAMKNYFFENFYKKTIIKSEKWGFTRLGLEN